MGLFMSLTYNLNNIIWKLLENTYIVDYNVIVLLIPDLHGYISLCRSYKYMAEGENQNLKYKLEVKSRERKPKSKLWQFLTNTCTNTI